MIGVWIVKVAWIDACFAAGYWLPEEPFECSIGDGLPRHHRIRATLARASTIDYVDDASNNQAANTAAPASASSGGIFHGWTMCVHVQKSANNRAFRR